MKLKRGTRVLTRYAIGNKTDPGKIIRQYHPTMPDWYLVESTDEHGTFRLGVHISQITVIDNDRRSVR